MPDVKGAQPVQSDAESAALKDKDKYKDSKNLKDDVHRNEELKNQPEKGSAQQDVRTEHKAEEVKKPADNGKKNDKLKKNAKKASSEAAKEGAEAGLKSEATQSQLKLMLQQQAAKTVSNAAQNNGLIQLADKFVTGLVNTWHSVTGFFSGGAQVGSNLLSAIGGFFANLGSGIASTTVGLATSAVSTVSAALGISTTAAAATTATATASVLAAGVFMAVSLATNGDIAQRDVLVDNCLEEVRAVQTEMAEGDYDAIMIANAQKIYSVLKVYGLAEENIAGVLGNWEVESWIDPTSVETIYSEKYQIGPRKQAAWDAGFAIEAIDASYAADYPLIKLAGLGLGGFTDTHDGAVNNTRLREFADANGVEWYTLECQLAFCLAPNENGGHGDVLFPHWDPEPNPRDAAFTFAKYWEGNTTLAQEERKANAEKWFAQFPSWSVDTTYANSIIDMAKTSKLGAGEKSTRGKIDACKEAGFANNSTIAMAAVSYAYSTEQEGVGNDGTVLYRRVHEAIFPGDPWFQSCDRSVACAVRWAGADDAFPAGGCLEILNHMLTSDKWSEIDWGGDSSKLSPGDVLIVSNDAEGHVILYVGNEAIKMKYPDAPADFEIVSGSIGGPARSPGCGVLWSSSYSHYRAFRNVKQETDSKYKNIAVGFVIDNNSPMGVVGGASAIADGYFSYPLAGYTWTTYDGHEGIDIPCAEGTPILAAADGTVSLTQTGHSNNQGASGMASYGNCVFVNHSNGWQSRYAHMTRVAVSQGQLVKKGEVIGYVGNTGNSYGAHLHIALYQGGINPGPGGWGNNAAKAWPSYKR